MNNKKKRIFPVISIIVALIMIFAGIYRNEYDDYYRKAIMICMQCIGIG